jgi:TDG/mug DNA glycosylase family protein
MNRVGVGFTDVVKRPSSSASSLRAADYRQDAPTLKANLLKYQPLVVCFNGLTAYKNYLRYAEGTKVSPALGAQERRIGTSRIFVVPSSSPANAAYSLEVLADWYVRLGEYRDRTKIQRNG